jgi:cobalt-zinc-cadmium efflux system membrane fusion protein
MTTRLSMSSLFVAFALVAGCGGSEPAKPAQGGPAPAAPAKTPIIPVKKAADWCKEHGVPESACTKCNTDLIAQFKEKGDWCDKHGVPKSQCIECDPSVAAKLAAMAPK